MTIKQQLNAIKDKQSILDKAIYKMQNIQHEVELARKNLIKAKDDMIFNLTEDFKETIGQLEADKEVLVNTLTSVSTKSYDLEKEMRDLKKRAS